MDEVHRPSRVRLRGRLPILAQLCLDPALRYLVPQLQAHFAVQPLRVDAPPFPTQQHMDTTIAVAHPSGGDLPDAFDQMSLPRLDVSGSGRSDRQRTASTSNAYLPSRSSMIHQLPLPDRLQSFQRITSCSISLSSDRSATILLQLAVLFLELTQSLHLRRH
jgi:hypothetical protein